MEGWYSSQVVVPDRNSDVIWLAPDGRELVGVYDSQGRWRLSGGEDVCYTPLFWCYAPNDDHGKRENTGFSRWLAGHRLRCLWADEDKA